MDQCIISLPREKADRIILLVRSFKEGHTYTAHRWLQLIGVLAATKDMTKLARLRLRPLQLYLHSQWNRSKQSLEYPVMLWDKVFNDLQWWRHLDNLLSGLLLFPAQEHCVFTTDASSLG